MVMRITPDEYMNQNNYPSNVQTAEISDIPAWVPILLGIALVGAFAVAFFAISINR